MFNLLKRSIVVSVYLLCVSSVSAQTKVVVIPLGGDDAPTSKTIFITKYVYGGDLRGPSGADERCQYAADNTPGSRVMGKKFKAWVSGGLAEDFTANNRIFITHDLPYIRVDGVRVADNYQDLVDNNIQNPISISPDGLLGARYAWTGIYASGSYHSDNCLSWTSNSNDHSALRGGASESDFHWTSNDIIECDLSQGLYCVEQ